VMHGHKWNLQIFTTLSSSYVAVC